MIKNKELPANDNFPECVRICEIDLDFLRDRRLADETIANIVTRVISNLEEALSYSKTDYQVVLRMIRKYGVDFKGVESHEELEDRLLFTIMRKRVLRLVG